MPEAPLPATLSRFERVLARSTPDRIVLAVALAAGVAGAVMGARALAHIRTLNKVVDHLVIETGGSIRY